MSLDTIDFIEKISIIFKLVKHYFNKSSIEFNIKLSINLANELDFLSKNAGININTNSEYLEQLNKLLKIILDYYPKILKDLNKSDIKRINNHLVSKKTNANNIINIIQCYNEYNEINYVMESIKDNSNQNITIISNNEKILNLITTRLSLEEIEYNNYAQYTKNYYKTSSLFKNKVAYYFNDINNKNLIKITKLLSFLDNIKGNNSNITICDLQNLTAINTSDVVFCLSMNNETWQLKHNLFNKENIDNIFNYILNNSRKLYCLYSSVVNGKPAIKSSLLNKLEVNKQYNLLHNTYNLNLSNMQNCQSDNIKLPEINNNLVLLSSSDIRNLLYEPNKFYFNNILGLHTNKAYEEDNIYNLFKDIFYRYFNKKYKKTYEDILKITEKLDLLHFKKFQQIIEYLEKNYKNDATYLISDNTLLETNINNSLVIKTHCDRIEMRNNTINIKKYCLNKVNNKSSILNGKETNLITQALILKNNRILNDTAAINLEIISPDWHNNTIPVSINSVQISIDNIENYLNNIINTLQHYKQVDILLDNNVINLSSNLL